MKEVRSPKKPLIFYYCIVLLIILLFNAIVTPLLSKSQVVEVDYGTFMDMIEDRSIGVVQVEDSQILFTDKDGAVVYKTGPMDDPTLTERLHDAGAEFTRVIEEPVSPLWSFLLTFVLPILIFFGLGQYLSKKLVEQAGGKNSMAFGMGKSSAKVYVQSTKGIKFADVAGEDEAKESLDPALTRPGRFDRRVPVELPDLAGREAILKVHAKKIRAADDVDFHTIARMAAGASGAELANIINEAALRAVRNGRTIVTEADLEESIEVVIAGYQKKNAVLSDKEKRMVAYHEIGHALVAALQTNSAPVQKITIIPRTSGALGYTMQVDTGDKYLLTREEIENKIATYTGGRAAEEVAFGQMTTGASNDIEQATKLARAMISRYGMSEDFDMVAMETVQNQYLGGDTSLACSPATQQEIDRRVVELVKAQHEKARRLLEENRSKLDELAGFLYERETITGEEFMQILEGGDKK